VSPPACDYSVDNQQDDRPEDGGESWGEVEELIDGPGVEQRSCNEPSKQGPHDASRLSRSSRCSQSACARPSSCFWITNRGCFLHVPPRAARGSDERRKSHFWQ
jgi:hypothetical protein